jgi:hypothetical protein
VLPGSHDGDGTDEPAPRGVGDRPFRRPSGARLFLGFAILPLADAAIAFVAFPLVWSLGGVLGQLTDPLGAARAFAIAAGFFGLLVTIVGAVPAVFWRLRRGPVPLRHAVIAGLLLGNAPPAGFGLMMAGFAIAHAAAGTLSERLLPISELAAGSLRLIAMGSTLGVVSGVLFWLVALRED